MVNTCPTKSGEIIEALDLGIKITMPEKAQHPWYWQQLNGIAAVFLVWDSKEVNRCLAGSLPERLHGRQLNRLLFSDVLGMEITLNGHHQGADQAADQTDTEGTGKEVDMLFLQQMISAFYGSVFGVKLPHQ